MKFKTMIVMVMETDRGCSDQMNTFAQQELPHHKQKKRDESRACVASHEMSVQADCKVMTEPRSCLF